MDNREQKLAEELAKDNPRYRRYLESLSNEELRLELHDPKRDRFTNTYMVLGEIFGILTKRGLMEGLLS